MFSGLFASSSQPCTAAATIATNTDKNIAVAVAKTTNKEIPKASSTSSTESPTSTTNDGVISLVDNDACYIYPKKIRPIVSSMKSTTSSSFSSTTSSSRIIIDKDATSISTTDAITTESSSTKDGDTGSNKKRSAKIKNTFVLPTKKNKKQGLVKSDDNTEFGGGIMKDEYDNDLCFICSDGGLLVICDNCNKSFHKHCHVPPLHAIPSGYWKCCECMADSYKKRHKCGQCDACLRDDCGKCRHCLDKTKFGGVGLLKQVCVHKNCPRKRYAPPATVSPEVKKHMVKKKSSKTGIACPKKSTNPSAGGKRKRSPAAAAAVGVIDLTSSEAKKQKYAPGEDAVGDIGQLRSKRAQKPSLRLPHEFAATAKQTKALAKQHIPSAATTPIESINIPQEEGLDVYSQPTAPLPNVTTAVTANNDDGNIPDDLWMCQTELRRVRAENKRQANEIKRLKSAVQALTASLTGDT